MGGIITGSGKNLMLHRLYTDSPTDSAVTVFMIGTGTADPVETGTQLNLPIPDWNASTGTKTFTSTTHNRTIQQMEARGFIASTQGSGEALAEVGEFNQDTNAVMMSHDTFSAFTKTNTEEIAVIWVHDTDSSE